MGLKHLQKIEVLLQSEDRFMSVSEIRDTIVADMYAVKDCLSYLEERKFVIKEIRSRGTYYKWKTNTC